MYRAGCLLRGLRLWWFGAKYVSLEKACDWFCGWNHENYIFCISYISIERLVGSHMPGMRYRKSTLDVIGTSCFSPFQNFMLG